MTVEAKVFHNRAQVERLVLEYAGRTNVFGGSFSVPEVQKDYEVLDIQVTAAQSGTANFGYHRRTYKLVPQEA